MKFTIHEKMDLNKYPLAKSIIDAQVLGIGFEDWIEGALKSYGDILDELYEMTPYSLKKKQDKYKHFMLAGTALEFWITGGREAYENMAFENLAHLLSYFTYLKNLFFVWEKLGGQRLFPKKPLLWKYSPFIPNENEEEFEKFPCDDAYYNPELTEEELKLVRAVNPRDRCDECEFLFSDVNHEEQHDYWEKSSLQEYEKLKKWHFKKYGCY